MGTYKSGILGAFSGKVGTVVGSSWNGIDYMRSLASHVANPRTAKQVENRNIFSLASSSLSPFSWAISKGFTKVSGQSGWSRAIKANLKIMETYIVPSGPLTFDYTKLVLSSGTEAFSVSVTSGRDNDYNVQWTPPDLDSRFYATTLYFVVFNQTTKDVEVYSSDTSTGSLTVELSGLITSETDKIVAYHFVSGPSVASSTGYHAF